jgi:hypothetical protein
MLRRLQEHPHSRPQAVPSRPLLDKGTQEVCRLTRDQTQATANYSAVTARSHFGAHHVCFSLAVSYAHDDKALAYPELQRIRSLGTRVWHDEASNRTANGRRLSPTRFTGPSRSW